MNEVTLDSDLARLYGTETKKINFDGQIYDAYSIMIDIYYN